MQQLNVFGYRTDYLLEFENQIAWYCDVLKEDKDSIHYSEHIVPHKGKAICGMKYEEYKQTILEGITSYHNSFGKRVSHKTNRINCFLWMP